jgi:hypothetical protein
MPMAQRISGEVGEGHSVFGVEACARPAEQPASCVSAATTIAQTKVATGVQRFALSSVDARTAEARRTVVSSAPPALLIGLMAPPVPEGSPGRP